MDSGSGIYGVRGVVQDGVGGWSGERVYLVAESFVRLIGLWLLNLIEGVGVGVRTHAVPVELGGLVLVLSAVIKFLLYVGVDKIFERKSGICLELMGHSIGCGVDRPAWLNVISLFGSDMFLRVVLVDTLRNCVDIHLREVIHRRSVNVRFYTGLFIVLTLVSSVLPYISELGVCITGVTAIVLCTISWPKSAVTKYSWIPLVAICVGVMPTSAVVGFFTTSTLTESTGVEMLVLKKGQIPEIAYAVLGGIAIPGLSGERLRFVTGIYTNEPGSLKLVKKYALVGDRFLKAGLAFECIYDSSMSLEDASNLEQRHQSNSTLGEFMRLCYPNYDVDYPVHYRGTHAATMVEAIVGVAALALRSDRALADKLYASIDKRITEMLGKREEKGASLTTVSSESSISVV